MAKEATKDVEMADAENPKTEDGEEKDPVLGKKEIDLMTLDGKSLLVLSDLFEVPLIINSSVIMRSLCFAKRRSKSTHVYHFRSIALLGKTSKLAESFPLIYWCELISFCDFPILYVSTSYNKYLIKNINNLLLFMHIKRF